MTTLPEIPSALVRLFAAGDALKTAIAEAEAEGWDVFASHVPRSRDTGNPRRFHLWASERTAPARTCVSCRFAATGI